MIKTTLFEVTDKGEITLRRRWPITWTWEIRSQANGPIIAAGHSITSRGAFRKARQALEAE